MLFGLETEYGIHVDGKGPAEMIAEARAVVRAWRGKSAGPWDYASETPRLDLRGFEVDRLNRDRADQRWDKDSERYESQSDERADRVLANGARFYNDHGHPEYATPECRSLYDLVAHDRAGERIVWESAKAHAESGAPVSIFKNNTDFHGASYGCHESYLIPRDIPYEDLQKALVPFLVTRQLYAGAGKVGVEPSSRSESVFQLSQRADFITETASIDTLSRRPVFNTRDEPHADPELYRRLHVVSGDANMNERATALKVGATAAVLRMVAKGWRSELVVREPAKAMQAISRDPSCRWIVELEGNRTMAAVDIQRVYATEASEMLSRDDDGEDVFTALEMWMAALDGLEQYWDSMVPSVDWAAKRQLIEIYREVEGLEWDHPFLRSLDLAYSDVNPETGLFRALEQEGTARSLVSEADIVRAMAEPPTDTRAAVRGALVDRFGAEIAALSWGGVWLGADGSRSYLDLGMPNEADAEAAAVKVRNASSLNEALRSLSAIS